MRDKDKPTYNNYAVPADVGRVGSRDKATLTSNSLPERDNALDASIPMTAKDTWKETEKAYKRRMAAEQGTQNAPPQQQNLMTSQNYQQVYLKKMRTQQTPQSTPDEIKARLAKKKAEEDRANELRRDAKLIQQQIRWWEDQRGNGTHDERVIDGEISLLRTRLMAIPTAYHSG